ncbi:xylose isomerase [Cereibacter sphaeroides]|nr:xylose isomerase [Cereibacter sphaeroides]
MTDFFAGIPQIRYEGEGSSNEFAFRHYNPDEVILGKRMEDHLRFAVAWWHSFAWPGGDPFGGQTFDRPWFGDTLDLAKLKADVAFEMFDILGAPFFCFHDADIRPEGATFAESKRNLEEIVDHIGIRMEGSKTKLLWGTANLFSHRRFMSGAATNPDPDVFAWSAATVKGCMDATMKLGGANYVLWGGREGYETLLNTDLTREAENAGRFLQMVVDYKHKIGFQGTILIEPKPQEPSKHQYDYDVATVYGFLKRFGLEKEVKLNIEQGHAILAGHSFEHELALAASLGILGSIDMNRNDYQSGWDTDQFPHNHPEMALAYYEILRAGGFTTGGTNFDAKIRRQSLDPEDLVLAHVGGMDTCARALKAAARLYEDGSLETARRALCGLGDARGAGDARLFAGEDRGPRAGRGGSTPSRARAGRSGWKTSGTASSETGPEAKAAPGAAFSCQLRRTLAVT